MRIDGTNINSRQYGRLLSKALPTIIRTEEENERALLLVEKLFAKGDDLTFEENALLELLVKLIAGFEEVFYPIRDARPQEVLIDMMSARGIKQKDLTVVFGSKGRASEAISGKREISKAQAKALAAFFNVSVELFINPSTSNKISSSLMREFLMPIFFLLMSLFGLSCSPAGMAENAVASTQSGDVKFRVETVAGGLEVPWGFAWLPNKDLLFTERPGRVRIIEKGKLRPEPVFTVPDVEPSGESGLMDISLHPDFAKNGFIYLAYSYNKEGKRVKVVRYKYANSTFTEPKTIVDDVPGAPNHSGMRCRFGPDGELYITTGDSTDWNLAQKTDSLAGKTLRLNDDGTIPKDNPFVGKVGFRPEIWSYGHRNAQGLAWQPGSGLMFQTEHGPSFFEGKGSGGDEVNIVERGKNYGWSEIHHTEKREGMESPLLEYSPACAPGSAMFYNGAAFPAFKGNFFFGCLVGKRIIRVTLDGRKVTTQENLLEGVYGRIREMEEGPDGYIYFSTSNRDGRGTPAKDDDRIMRIVPASQNRER